MSCRTLLKEVAASILTSELIVISIILISRQYVLPLQNLYQTTKQILDIVLSGLKGWIRREARKEKLKIPRFRSGQCSLKVRSDKRLIEKYNWFKMRKIDDDKNDKNDNDEKENVDKVKKWNHYRKRKPKIGAIEMDDAEKVAKEPPKAVLFVPYTVNSELASQIKKVIQDLRP